MVVSTVEDYRQAQAEVKILIDNNGCGPLLVRLAWHDAGTYDAATGTGGPNGSMRFAPVSQHGANNGLEIARNLLQPIKDNYPSITCMKFGNFDIVDADLWSLAGATAIEHMGGPKVIWRAGRKDVPEGVHTPDGRLPDATQGSNHLRAIFNRMGFNDQEIVALSGAHKLGGCHADRSGFKGNWSLTPNKFNNGFFRDLLSLDWEKTVVPETGNVQYWNTKRGIMMLPTDVCMLEDPAMREYVEIYAKDKNRFYGDFSAVFQKLLELGVANSLITMDL